MTRSTQYNLLEWQERALGEVTQEVSDRLGKMSDAPRIYGVERETGLTPSPKYMSKDLSRYKQIRPGMFAYNPMRLNIGSIGFCSPEHSPGAVSPDYVVFACREGELDSGFLHYFTQSPAWHDWVRVAGVGSVRVRIYYRELARMLVRVPPLHEQRAIAAVLSSLDDKIEQNRRTGRILERLARATFKAWFVDFEPVKSKIAGATGFPGMPAAAFAALPTRFVDSELGPVPEGWAVASIKERAKSIQYGMTTSAVENPAGPKFLRITDIRGGQLDWSTVPFCVANEAERQKYRLLDGDIVVARTGASTGENCYVVQPPDAVFASYLVRFQFENSGIGRIVGEFMRTDDYFAFVKGSIGGSAQPNANAQTLAAARTVFPTNAVADRFYEWIRPVDLKRSQDASESRKLAALRDYLLPRLLSGKVRVKDVAEGVIA